MKARNQLRMAGAQKKVMLNHLGIDYDDIPTKIGEIDPLLDAFMNKDPDRYRRTYDLVVNCKLPDGATTQDKGYLGVAELIRDHLEPTADTLKVKIQNEVNMLQSKVFDGINRIETKQDKTVEYLESESNRISSGLKAMLDKEIAAAAKRYERIEIKVGRSKPVDMTGEIMHDDFEKVVQLASNRINVMLVGPAGCGKTHMAGQVAKALKLDYAAQSCSAGMSESQLTGWLLPTGDNGKFVYVSSEFIRIYENGGVFLFDEMDAADPNVLIFINSALANGEFFLPQRFEKPKVKKHKDFVAIAAANTFGGGADAIYTARNALDGATLDRFRLGMIGMDYSEELEKMLVDENVLQLGQVIRSLIKTNKLRKILSTRFMLDATKMRRNCDWTIREIYESFVSDWSPEELRVARLPEHVDALIAAQTVGVES